MKYFVLILFPLFYQFFSCEQNMKVTGDFEFSNHTATSVFDWELMKKNFPNQNILVFDFSDKGQPVINIDNLPKIDDELFENLIQQNPNYRNWKGHLSIYYFSLNIISNREVGIFLSVKEFDGMEYNFDLIQFDDMGKVLVFKTIANSWEAAECFGYTRAKIDLKENLLYSEEIRSCYDFELEKRRTTDSISTNYSIENLEFKKIETKN